MTRMIRGRALRPDDLLEINEIVEHYHLSRKFIQELIREGHLEIRRVGKRAIRVVASSWVDYLNQLNPNHPEVMETGEVQAADVPV